MVMERRDRRELAQQQRSARNVVVRTAFNRSGEVFRRPMLYLDNKRLREEIIAKHYRGWRSHHEGKEPPGKLVARDKPYDFSYRNDSGDELHVEITAAADSEGNFVVMEAEGRLNAMLVKRGVTDSTLAVLPHGMSTRAIRPLVDRALANPPVPVVDMAFREQVSLAYRNQEPALFRFADGKAHRQTYVDNIRISVEELVVRAIEAKVVRQYPLASQLVLIVDEQSVQHSQLDFHNAWDNLISIVQHYPFREIHLYSGWYSNDDGRAAQCCMYTLKSDSDAHVDAVLKRGPCPATPFVDDSKHRVWGYLPLPSDSDNAPSRLRSSILDELLKSR